MVEHEPGAAGAGPRVERAADAGVRRSRWFARVCLSRARARRDRPLRWLHAAGGNGLRIVLLGAPGSGKGTQAERLHKSFRLVQLSTGNLFREHISKGTALGVRVKDILAKGELVPDDVTIQMVMDRISRPDCAPGVVFDGFPRTVASMSRTTSSSVSFSLKILTALIGSPTYFGSLKPTVL